MGDIFSKYTEAARRVVFFARYEASGCGEGLISAEHLLLGICREDPAALQPFGYAGMPEVAALAESLRNALPMADFPTHSDMALSGSAKSAIAAAAESAADPAAIHPSDLLDAISRQPETLASRLLLGK